MSSPFDTLKTELMTVYGVTGSDLYGAKTYGVKGVVACEYMQGGTSQTDQEGVEFVPASTFYPAATNFTILRGDRVAIGDTSAESDPDAAGAEVVRKVSNVSNPFGWDFDVMVFTG